MAGKQVYLAQSLASLFSGGNRGSADLIFCLILAGDEQSGTQHDNEQPE